MALKVLLAYSEIAPLAKAGDVCEALPKALRCFKERQLWHKLVLQAIAQDFSRAHSAGE